MEEILSPFVQFELVHNNDRKMVGKGILSVLFYRKKRLKYSFSNMNGEK